MSPEAGCRQLVVCVGLSGVTTLKPGKCGSTLPNEASCTDRYE